MEIDLSTRIGCDLLLQVPLECHTVYAKLVDTIQDDEDSCFR